MRLNVLALVFLALAALCNVAASCSESGGNSVPSYSDDPVIQKLDRDARLMKLDGTVISRIVGCRIPVSATSDSTQQVYGDPCLVLLERGGINDRTLIAYRFVAHLVVQTDEGNYTVDLPYCSDGVTCSEPNERVGDTFP